MTKFYAVLAILVAVFTMGCSVTNHGTSNRNAIQTNVELSTNNFRVIGQVYGSARASYFFGIGGLSRRSLEANAYADMVRKANLKGSQTLINVNLEEKNRSIIVYGQKRINATATIIEFVTPNSSGPSVENVENESAQARLDTKTQANIVSSSAQDIIRPDFHVKSLVKEEIDAMSRNKRDSYKIALDKELLDACRHMDQYPESIKEILPKTEELFESYNYLISTYYPGPTYLRGYQLFDKHITKFKEQLSR